MRLRDKVAIITGGASGIGRASCILFAREGATVVVSDIADKSGEDVLTLIKENGGKGIYVHCDVTREGEAKNLIERALENYGRIDVLYNNAGIGMAKLLPEMTEQEWDRIFDINVKGAFFCSKYAIPQMKKQGGGTIINTASNWGLIAYPHWPAYCATKGAMVMLTKALAIDHAPDNIRVNCVCPGNTDTPLEGKGNFDEATGRWGNFDEAIKKTMGRIARPEEIAYLALFLASDESSFVTGAAMVIDNGESARGGPTWPSSFYFKI
jgi:NAD(P)-dependent dehydrogenase (short-subunit alcohol dehydrogenase family)